MKNLLAVGPLAVIAILAGCDSTTDKVSLLEQENTELRDQLSQRDKALESANTDLREANRMLREQEIMFDDELTTLASGVSSPTAFDGIEGVSTSVSGREVTVTVASDVLFDSGRTSLKSNAKSSLDQVASVIQSRYPGRQVRVIGHTDSDPIRKSGNKSNYHLGFERGYAVRDYLISRGMDSSQVSITSFGPNQSLGSKSQSRRVEIVVAE
ncbi:MAG: OmpA family protein [Phycisphaerales bacterium]|nr:OmpA family protein [Phycisphaerales bacterium]